MLNRAKRVYLIYWVQCKMDNFCFNALTLLNSILYVLWNKHFDEIRRKRENKTRLTNGIGVQTTQYGNRRFSSLIFIFKTFVE